MATMLKLCSPILVLSRTPGRCTKITLQNSKLHLSEDIFCGTSNYMCSAKYSKDPNPNDYRTAEPTTAETTTNSITTKSDCSLSKVVMLDMILFSYLFYLIYLS